MLFHWILDTCSSKLPSWWRES